MTATYSQLMEEHRSQRREALLRVAADALLENGLHQTTMDQIAAGAGVSKVVLYRYFGSRDKLVHAVLDDIVEEILRADQEPAEWWTERVRRTLALSRNNVSAIKLLVRHAAHDPEYGRHFERLTAALVERVEERQQEILGDAGQLPTDKPLLAEAITAFLLDAYVRWMDEGDPDAEEAFLGWLTRSIRAMAFYWRGLEPPPPV